VASFYSLWAGVVAFTFAISGPMHVVSPGTIAQSMSESTGLRRPAVAGGLSRSVGLLELASATAILFGSDRIALAGLLAASLILVAYVAYIWWLLEARPGVACGCGRGSEPPRSGTLAARASFLVPRFSPPEARWQRASLRTATKRPLSP